MPATAMSATVVLAMPPKKLRDRVEGNVFKGGNTMASYGLASLAGALREAGITVRIIESSYYDFDMKKTVRAIMKHRPSFVGLSATTNLIADASRLATHIKCFSPETQIIVGGPHITAYTEETLLRYDCFDYAVTGEGERTLVHLLSTLLAGRPLNNVAGIAYRRGRNVIRNEPRPFIEDIDRLPMPAWDLIEGFPDAYRPFFHFKRLPVASLVTSRGCPHSCSFCDKGVFGTRTRFHSADRVLAMIERLHFVHGVRGILFDDDAITLDKKRLDMILSGLRRKGLAGMEESERGIIRKIYGGRGIDWAANSRVDCVDKDMLVEMKKSGCWQICFGIESGDEKVLSLMNKGIHPEQSERAVRLAREAGLRVKGFFVIGAPGETGESLRKTEEFILRLPLDDLTLTFFTPFKGSPIYEKIHEWGKFEENWEKLNFMEPCFIPFGLNAKYLKETFRRILLRFYLRPRILASCAAMIGRNPLPFLESVIGFIKTDIRGKIENARQYTEG